MGKLKVVGMCFGLLCGAGIGAGGGAALSASNT